MVSIPAARAGRAASASAPATRGARSDARRGARPSAARPRRDASSSRASARDAVTAARTENTRALDGINARGRDGNPSRRARRCREGAPKDCECDFVVVVGRGPSDGSKIGGAARAPRCRRRRLHGKLTQYRTPAGDARCAFISGTSSDDGGVAVYLGGLTDGPMASPYALELAATLEARGWALCQPVLSSSYLGFGVCSLETDVADLDAMLEQCLPEESDWEERANDAAANDADGATARAEEPTAPRRAQHGVPGRRGVPQERRAPRAGRRRDPPRRR